MRRTPSSVKRSVTSSVSSSAAYCDVSDASGSVRMRTKSSVVSDFSSTRIGKRPCSSGIRSDGLDTWKAPEAMNRMWSVLTMPYLVDTVEPSTSGSRSRCTPSRDTSAPCVPDWRATLSISSMNTMPCCSTASSAWVFSSSSSSIFAASSSVSIRNASLIFSLRVLRRLPPRFWNMLCSWLVISSMPGGAMISTPTGIAWISISISLSSSLPSRSILRNFCRVSLSAGVASDSAVKPTPRDGGGSSASSTRSSAASSARWRTLAIASSRVILMDTSIRSRTMLSTSRPT